MSQWQARKENSMNKLANKLIIGFVLLVLFDSTSFDLNLEKHQFSLLGSVVKTVSIIKDTVKVFI
jgi:hypothetical protein